ncbi:glycosyltransferase family 4 protein [Antarcticibacterium flavum]|uniref:Glycosyltransferase family 4 protein n=1 Tax=Antarcticibacterium flavum TaxID=2058175 RepID=A0A5B7WZY5_9FLAO|nr:MULTISPECIES: glycosyltransferase family 4 protein [Antarcticibacterium]MCM4160820.1 hypothetical protein [Antarcticibacterium sp. W02-3]QCY67988.1 glycosyltransferase family 4 protein [Antarcticibacterium flavum]
MKIHFICGCLEKGRDGVGDYTRNLAGELMKIGHKVSITSLNDYFVPIDFLKEETQDLIPVLRVRLGNARKQLLINVQKRIEEFDPDWVSLQFVPFSFHYKGLPWRLAKQLAMLGCGRKWHIMFHELWLGGAQSDPVKYKILGGLQKRLVMRVLDKIKPVKVFTNTYFYKNLLESKGVKAVVVPVFSNIPVGHSENSLLFNLLPKKVLNNRERYIIASFFGNVEFTIELERNLLKLKRLTQIENKELLISHIGNSEGVVERFQEWDDQFGIKAIIFGIQEELSIAAYFQKIDIGLSSYPKILLEKSGSIAAMNHNNLPVILLRKSFERDPRPLDWVKEIHEIFQLSKFISSAKSNKSHFGIERSIAAYTHTFNQSQVKRIEL